MLCRLKGDLKVALRRVIERYELPVIITANQNIILTEIEPSWKSDILNTLHGAGVRYVTAIHLRKALSESPGLEQFRASHA